MIHFRNPSDEACGRELLRRLRDACLGPCCIDLAEGERVRLMGCLSTDHPVELGVLFGLEDGNGKREVLRIRHRAGRIEVSLNSPCNDRRPPKCELALELVRDRFGRLSSPGLGARVDLALHDERELEHFLRRIIRVLRGSDAGRRAAGA